MSLGARIKSLINERDLKQNEVAKELHMAPSTLNGYLNDVRQPDYATLIRIADYFGVSVDYLLGVTNIRKKPETLMNEKEGELVGIYRGLGTDTKELFMDQLRSYLKFDLKQKEQKKKKP